MTTRRKPIRRRAPLRRKSPVMRSRKPIRKVNPARRKRLFAEDFGGAEYLVWIQAMPCAICGVSGFTQASHVRSRGAGGKASDIVPLCQASVMGRDDGSLDLRYGCHAAFDTHQLYAYGQKPRLIALAKKLWADWQLHQANQTGSV